ncbi:MAG: hypothetical protein JW741_01895, partial [Sedimentisphaerales bacterium]|nr:hypothetical protein [Sedimentisphaerales bacterium]
MASLTSTTRCRPLGPLRTILLLVFVLVPATAATADPRWMLIYYRQYGNQLNANNRTIENHCFNENGT